MGAKETNEDIIKLYERAKSLENSMSFPKDMIDNLPNEEALDIIGAYLKNKVECLKIHKKILESVKHAYNSQKDYVKDLEDTARKCNKVIKKHLKIRRKAIKGENNGNSQNEKKNEN